MASRGGRTRHRSPRRCATGAASPREPAAPVYIPLPHPSWRNNGWLRRQPVVRDRTASVFEGSRSGGFSSAGHKKESSPRSRPASGGRAAAASSATADVSGTSEDGLFQRARSAWLSRSSRMNARSSPALASASMISLDRTCPRIRSGPDDCRAKSRFAMGEDRPLSVLQGLCHGLDDRIREHLRRPHGNMRVGKTVLAPHEILSSPLDAWPLSSPSGLLLTTVRKPSSAIRAKSAGSRAGATAKPGVM